MFPFTSVTKQLQFPSGGACAISNAIYDASNRKLRVISFYGKTYSPVVDPKASLFVDQDFLAPDLKYTLQYHFVIQNEEHKAPIGPTATR